MKRIATANVAADLFGPGKNGFRAAVPGVSDPTYLAALWFNHVQEAVVRTCEAANFALSDVDFDQFVNAIKRLGQKMIVLADTGVVNAYTAVNNPPLVAADLVNGLVQQIAIAHTNTGPSTYSPDGLAATPIYGLALQSLQGNELPAGGTAVLQRTTIAGVNGGNPIYVLMECMGGSQQIPTATKPQHAVPMSMFSSLLSPNGYKQFPDPNSPTGYSILQFGTGTGSVSSDFTVTFPIQFPTACLKVIASCDYTLGSGSAGYVGVSNSTLSKTGFNGRSSGTFSTLYFAFGY